MAGWRAGKTGSRLVVLLLLALVYTATPATLQCPKGKLWTNEPLELQADCAQEDTCCKYDQSMETYACGKGNACDGDGVCKPEDGKKCCVKVDKQGDFSITEKGCEAPWPFCVVGSKSDARHEACQHGLSVYDYATDKYFIATPVNGKWPEITATQITCRSKAQTKGEMKCCAQSGGGFNWLPYDCAKPDIMKLKCPVEVAEDPVTLDCKQGQSGQCCVMDGRGRAKCHRGALCQREEACRPGKYEHCCLDAAGEKVEVVKKTAKCSGPIKGLKCPVEVAEDPSTVPCDIDNAGGCCLLDGRRRAKCFRDDYPERYCRTKGACWPRLDKGEKCCLDAAGEKVEVVKNTTKCSGPIKGLKCPVEVAEDPSTVPCDIDNAGGCCLLDGRRRAKCFRDDYPERYCRTKEACWPRLNKGEKCCLDAAGEKVEVVKNTTKCSGPIKGLKCPVEVAEDPSTVPCDIDNAGGCCLLDGRRRAKCFRDDYPERYCRTKEACWPRLDKGEKCCLDAAGEKVVVVNSTKCSGPIKGLKCPVEVAEDPSTVPCDIDNAGGCCLLDGRRRAKCFRDDYPERYCRTKEACWPRLDKGEKCCLDAAGEKVEVVKNTTKCSGPIKGLKCPVEVAEYPFTVSCSAPGRTQCCIMDGRRKSKCFGGVDCQSTLACYPEEGEKCCLDAAGEKVEAVKNTTKCFGPIKGLKCPVEVAEDPFTVPCDIYHAGGCCVLDGRRRAKCFRDDYPEQYCRTKEACWPRLDKGEKCCLDAAGEKVEVVNRTTACPHRAFLLDWPPTPKPRCEDRGAVMKAECGAKTTEEGAACARRVELCLEGEAVPAAEAAGKACDEAWAHCLHSHAKGPTAHPLLTAVLLLLLPN